MRPRPLPPPPIGPYPVSPDDRPGLAAALAAVNRDLATTRPDLPQLALTGLSFPERDGNEGQGGQRAADAVAGFVYVSLTDGRAHGSQLYREPEDPDLPLPTDPVELLAAVADAGQETVAAELWLVWPVCPQHDKGLHVGAAATWVCRVGTGGHAVGAIGELASGCGGRHG